MLIAPEGVYTPTGDYAFTTVLSTTFTLQAPEHLRVTDQIEVSIQPNTNAEVNNDINCRQDGSGNEIDEEGTGTNYTGSTLQWSVSLLILAPAGTNSCELRVHTGYEDTNVHYLMKVLAPTTAQTTGTWLEVSSQDEVGALQQRPPVVCDFSVPNDCNYVGGPGKSRAIDVFSPLLPPAVVWQAGDDATFIDAVGTFEITTCDNGTMSCNPSEIGGSDGSAVVTYLEVDQLNPNMTVCQTHRAYTEQHPNGDTFDISNAAHHQPLYFHVIAPVSQTCGGSRTFGIDPYVELKGGNPIIIEGVGNVNVINSVRETTTTVPPVTGDTQAQADAAIQAAGLMAEPVNIVSPSAPGTVVGQNAPAGTVEPTGSPVQIMVSVGQATVPPVLSDKLSTATAAIRNAGLKVGTVSYVNDCVDPGTVQSQDPLPGAQVALGSPVNIKISICISPTQPPK
jgi:hypothetical protein